MKALPTRLIAGLFLIGAGALFLLQNLRIIRLGGLGDLFVAAFFGLGALAFLAVFLANREHWWSLIPAGALFGIGGLIAMDWLLPSAASALGGSFFLGSLSLPFTWPAGVPAGTKLYWQQWVNDAGATKNLSASNGLESTSP